MYLFIIMLKLTSFLQSFCLIYTRKCDKIVILVFCNLFKELLDPMNLNKASFIDHVIRLNI